jgi:hypothetical protein
MSKLEQRAVIRLVALIGLRPQQVLTDLSDMYHQQGSQLAAVEKWHLRFADGTRGVEDESRHGQPRKIDFTGPIRELLREKPFTSCRAICRRLETPKTTCFRVLHEELGLRGSICARFHTLSMRTRGNNGSLCHSNFCKCWDRTRNNSSRIVLPGRNAGPSRKRP